MAQKEPRFNYKLRCSLIEHSLDVRAVAITPNNEIITASRDKTAILWKEESQNA